MLKRLSKNAKITLSILFCFTGIILLVIPYLGIIKSNVFNQKNLKLLETITLEQEIDEVNEDPIVEDDEEPEEEPVENVLDVVDVTTTTTTVAVDNTDKRDNYIGYLEVPDVGIKRGFVSPSSKYNSIGYNVTIIKGSSFPDVKNGNFILAAHRGSSKVSFFENLYKVKIGSLAYVTYNGKTYTYKLLETYELPKTGTLTISRDPNKTTLTLITCTRNNKKTQTIFNYELISVK